MIIPLWYAQRKWAEELIMRSLELDSPEEILTSEKRKNQTFPGTNWRFKVHGFGIDIYREEMVGGIDFDFDKPDPEPWRLKLFFERQYNEGSISLNEYRHLFEDEELLTLTIKESLK